MLKLADVSINKSNIAFKKLNEEADRLAKRLGELCEQESNLIDRYIAENKGRKQAPVHYKTWNGGKLFQLEKEKKEVQQKIHTCMGKMNAYIRYQREITGNKPQQVLKQQSKPQQQPKPQQQSKPQQQPKPQQQSKLQQQPKPQQPPKPQQLPKQQPKTQQQSKQSKGSRNQKSVSTAPKPVSTEIEKKVLQQQPEVKSPSATAPETPKVGIGKGLLTAARKNPLIAGGMVGASLLGIRNLIHEHEQITPSYWNS